MEKPLFSASDVPGHVRSQPRRIGRIRQEQATTGHDFDANALETGGRVVSTLNVGPKYQSIWVEATTNAIVQMSATLTYVWR